MPFGQSTGLPIDDWNTQIESWEADDIRTNQPLVYNETIEIAMFERLRGRNGIDDFGANDAVSYQRIATQGEVARAFHAQSVRSKNVDNATRWINHNIDGGVYHGNTVVAPRWTETDLAEDIQPGVPLSDVQQGDYLFAEWAEEQYNLINRMLWYSTDDFQDIFGDPGQNIFGSSLVDVERQNGQQETLSKNTELDIGLAIPFANSGARKGAGSSASPVLSVGSFNPNVGNPVVSVGPTNETNQVGVNDRTRVRSPFEPFGFNLQREFDRYLFAVRPTVRDISVFVESGILPITGQLGFSDHLWPGVQDTVWTYVYDDTGDYDTGISGSSHPPESGYQINITPEGLFAFAIRDPFGYVAQNGGTVEQLIVNGVQVVRCDVEGGFAFLDPSINPSNGYSLPNPISVT